VERTEESGEEGEIRSGGGRQLPEHETRLLRGVMCLGLLHRARGVMLFPPM
jgi:hypothetical protein